MGPEVQEVIPGRGVIIKQNREDCRHGSGKDGQPDATMVVIQQKLEDEHEDSKEHSSRMTASLRVASTAQMVLILGLQRVFAARFSQRGR